MTDFTWPSNLVPMSASSWMIDGTKTSRSPLSGTMRTIEVHPAYWELSLGFTNLTAAQGQELEALCWKINGKADRLLVPMFDYERQGAGGGTPRVAGGSQTGKTLATDGWPASTLVLKAGDRFSVDGQCFAVTADVTSSAGGAATLSLANSIRTSPSDNALLETTRPVVRCVLKSIMGLSSRPGIFKSGQIEFEEAVPA